MLHIPVTNEGLIDFRYLPILFEQDNLFYTVEGMEDYIHSPPFIRE